MTDSLPEETMTVGGLPCSKCGADCKAHHFMCDRMEGQWCGPCFDRTPCGRGKHGEGCPTQVFDDGKRAA